MQFAAYVWDLSIFEVWASLTTGGCICIPSEEQRLGNLAKAVSDLQAEWAFFTPTFARSLEPKDFGSLRVVVLGGEAAGTTLRAGALPRTCEKLGELSTQF